MRCRICGCTEADACVDEHGTTCIWAQPGLCSFCARGILAVNRPDITEDLEDAIEDDDEEFYEEVY